MESEHKHVKGNAREEIKEEKWGGKDVEFPSNFRRMFIECSSNFHRIFIEFSSNFHRTDDSGDAVAFVWPFHAAEWQQKVVRTCDQGEIYQSLACIHKADSIVHVRKPAGSGAGPGGMGTPSASACKPTESLKTSSHHVTFVIHLSYICHTFVINLSYICHIPMHPCMQRNNNQFQKH